LIPKQKRWDYKIWNVGKDILWEDELIEIYNKEEIMWQTRGGEKWLL
jgi:hypothetical protein